MLYHCYQCGKHAFETSCPHCGDAAAEHYVPLDPKYYPEFQYRTQGLVKDFLFKKQEQKQLGQKLDNVLQKYEQFKHPYFVNYLHIAKEPYKNKDAQFRSTTYANLKLFQLVLTRLGFHELNEYDQLTVKLLHSTEFSFDYANFVSQIKQHIKNDLTQTVHSWISEVGSRYRRDLHLLIYYLWISHTFVEKLAFNDPKTSATGVPLIRQDNIEKIREKCERIYLDIQITRFKAKLENFDPEKYINIYTIDSMSGYDFEDFLVKLFAVLGYDVEETRKSQDQGADLFVSKFGKKMVIQAKNYKDNVGNAAVQQVISAKAFFNCDEAMVITNSYFTRSAIELAGNTQVTLMDRDGLQTLLDEYNQLIIEASNEIENADFELSDGEEVQYQDM